jgi:hypothetical protein
LEHFPITWNLVIGKESRKINELAQVLFEELAAFSRWAFGRPPVRAAAGSEHGFRGVFQVAFG